MKAHPARLGPAKTFLSALIFACFFAPQGYAQLTLSTRLLQGGIDLDLGRAEPGQPTTARELEVTMTNTATGQYRLYQEVSGFLVNERGTRLPEGAILYQISRGTQGTPSSGAIMPLSEPQQELYVSNAAGSSDSVVVAYTLSVSAAATYPAGNYRGALRLTLESRQTGTLTTTIVNVRLTVGSIVQLERLPGASNQLRFDDVEPAKPSSVADFSFHISNNAAGPVTLIQQLVEPLVGAQGEYFPADALTYLFVASNASGSWQSVGERPQRILSNDQSVAGKVHLSYRISVPQDQRAGAYRGKLRLRLLGSAGGIADEWMLPLEVSVREVFTVNVAIVEGGEAMHFRRNSAGSSSEHTMQVSVVCNTGKPYQVLGGLDHPLVLPSGETLPAASLRWMVDDAKRGRPLISPKSPIAIGLEPIYQSDSNGSSETFLVRYQMTIPEDARDGVYSARMHFSVTAF